MKYVAPEYSFELVETNDVVTASSSVKVETSEEKTDVFAGIDDILNKIF